MILTEPELRQYHSYPEIDQWYFPHKKINVKYFGFDKTKRGGRSKNDLILTKTQYKIKQIRSLGYGDTTLCDEVCP
jgi:hypothetical protein